MLALYIEEMLRNLEALLESARILQRKFEDQRSVDELLLDAESLRERMGPILARLPDSKMGGGCSRHVGWMVKRLREKKPSDARSDIDDLVANDIPGAIAALRKWSEKADYLDPALRNAVAPLVGGWQLDSAVRKAFVLLTDRFRQIYGLPNSVDGEDLVNKVFESPRVP